MSARLPIPSTLCVCVGAVEMSKLYAIVASGGRKRRRQGYATNSAAVCECRNLGHMVEYFWTFFFQFWFWFRFGFGFRSVFFFNSNLLKIN